MITANVAYDYGRLILLRSQSIASFRQPRSLRGVVLAIVVLSVFVAAHLAAARAFYRSWPSTYSWSELLINYQGGFTKRGLLGEAVFQLRGAVGPRHALMDAVCGAYLLAMAGLILPLRFTGSYAGLLFLASPLGSMFSLLNSDAYGRKDAFVLLALVWSTVAVQRARGRTAALLIPMAIFALTGFIVEIAWFYYPLVFAATLGYYHAEPTRWRVAATASAALYTGGCLLLTLAVPHVDTAAIAHSWSSNTYDTATTGALCCLNLRLSDAIGIAMLELPGLGSYMLGFAIGLLPAVLLLIAHPVRRIDALTHATALAAVILAISPIFLAADWGRYFALWTTATFLWLWIVAPCHSSRRVVSMTAEECVVRIALLCLYASTWQLAFSQWPERSALLPGLLFRSDLGRPVELER